jgi:hypothetical protein
MNDASDRGGDGKPALFLATDGNELSISYSRLPSATGPRAAEIFIRHSNNLELGRSSPGDAALAASKGVFVQERDENTLRVMVFAATNTNELGSGVLATLHMRRSDERPAAAEILLDNPVFAPRAALRGLKIGDPVSF